MTLRKLFLFLVAIAVLLGTSASWAWWWVGEQSAGIRPPGLVNTPGPFIHNGLVGIWPERTYQGITDLFYFDPAYQAAATGHWRQFNNLVPVASTGMFTNNAEMERAHIDAEVLESRDDWARVRLQFDRFSNGIHLQLVATLDQTSIRMEVVPNEDSSPIQWVALGMYAGFLTWPNEVSYEGGTLHHDGLQTPVDGPLKPGTWVQLRGPSVGNAVEVRARSPVVQRLTIEPQMAYDDRLEAELRATPWLASLPGAERPWFETVQLVRDPFMLGRNIWELSVETPSLVEALRARALVSK